MIINSENNNIHSVNSGSILTELFFQPTVRSQILFLDRRPEQDFFLTHMDFRDDFFKITPPSEVKWLTPYYNLLQVQPRQLKSPQGHPTSMLGKYLFRRRFEI